MTLPAQLAANRRNALLSTGPRTAAGKLAVARNPLKHGIFANLAVVPGECPAEREAHRAGVLESLDPVGLLEVDMAERAADLLWRLRRVARYEAAVVTADVEDAGLPPPGHNPLAARAPITFHHPVEAQLVMARQDLDRARENMAATAPEAHLLRRLRDLDDLEPLTSETVTGVLVAAFDRAYESPIKNYVPAHPTDPRFVEAIGCDGTRFADVAWTRELVLTGLRYYASATELGAADFRAEVQAVLDARRDAFARDVDRLEADVAGLVRRAERERRRAADSALLPPDTVIEKVMKYEKHLHSQLTSTLHELERLQARRGGMPVLPPVVADLHVSVVGGSD